jgi:hypothetical protein
MNIQLLTWFYFKKKKKKKKKAFDLIWEVLGFLDLPSLSI